MSKRYLWLWALWFLVGVAFEVWGVWLHRNGDDTFSEFLIWVFHVQTIVGWLVMIAVVGFVLAWLPGHLRHLALMKAESAAKRKDMAARATGQPDGRP